MKAKLVLFWCVAVVGFLVGGSKAHAQGRMGEQTAERAGRDKPADKPSSSEGVGAKSSDKDRAPSFVGALPAQEIKKIDETNAPVRDAWSQVDAMDHTGRPKAEPTPTPKAEPKPETSSQRGEPKGCPKC